nr:MAG TPA: minor capsid protein [Microviridae sp.]
MGFLDFLGGGGSGLITGLAGTIAGAVSSAKDRDMQRELQQKQMEYGREMYALQNRDENRRMELQNQWNKEAAAKSQEYAKEMFDYTGYENQVKQMKAAGLNPALLNGGSGSPGQAHGATVSPATAMQPMGLQVALQAQQTAAQTALINAQAEKTRSETTAQKVENLVGIGIDLAKKVAEVRKNKKDTEEVEQKIENLKKTAEATEESIKLIKANIENKEVQTRIAQFQDDMNNVIKSSVWYENGKSQGWEETVIERYYKNFKKDMATLSHDEKKMLFDKKILDKLSNDIGLIAKGKLDEMTKPTQELQLMLKKYEREDWELEQDQAFSKMLDEMTGQGEYAKMLGSIIKMIVGKL